MLTVALFDEEEDWYHKKYRYYQLDGKDKVDITIQLVVSLNERTTVREGERERERGEGERGREREIHIVHKVSIT